MRVYEAGNTPQENLAIMAENPYHGRMLMMGYVGDLAVQAYVLEGRSDGSQNRILVNENNIISTEIDDPNGPKGNPELTVYDVMRSVHGLQAVTNGNQTDRIMQFVRSGNTFMDAMDANATTFEPDSLHTPRISGFIDITPEPNQPQFGISVVRKGSESDDPIKAFYSENSPDIDLRSGVGYAVHTYKGDPEAPESFDEPPFAIPIEGSAKDMLDMLLDTVQPSNRVAIVTKTIDRSGRVDYQIANDRPYSTKQQ